jgi:hypothetical protein
MRIKKNEKEVLIYPSIALSRMNREEFMIKSLYTIISEHMIIYAIFKFFMSVWEEMFPLSVLNGYPDLQSLLP